MRLKSVRIFGFKTFADRTEFDVRGGIVAVVGPNGCGKSNLVDAILWGLGEGNARQLRAQTSQDVIFSGSARRKAVGYAEVTLLFDNEDGALPIDAPEVAISRKLNRAGDSEYRINRSACRLKDVLDLLADSGLGRAGYAIVGQKEIDQALAASPEDRRAWVDEAAGVQRYRARKVEAQRRLSAAATHLERVSDILSEIEGQLEPLRGEAETARRYRQLQNSLREVETGLLASEIAKAVNDLEALAQSQAEAYAMADRESQLAEALEAEIQASGAKVRELERTLDDVRQRLQDAGLRAERAEGSLRLGEQKLRALVDLEANLGEERPGTGVEQAEAEVTAARAEVAREERALRDLAESSLGASEAAQKLAAELKELEDRLSAARSSHADQLKRQAEVAHAAERIKSIQREIRGIDGTLPDLEKGLEDAQAVAQEHVDRLAQLEASAGKCAQALQDLAGADERDQDVLRKWLGEAAALEGRKQGLEMTIAAHEGLTHGARAVLEAVAQGLLEDAYRPVGEAIDAPPDLALAIEVALGHAANDLICPDPEAAKAAIRVLKEHQLGRATFQPVSLMRPARPDLTGVLGLRGVVGRASELVTCAPADRPVIDSLLGRIVIVETLDDALALARTQGWSRLVTLDGEVVHHAGAVTGGQSNRPTYGLVQRKADLTNIDEALERLAGKVAAAQQRVEQRRAERDAVEKDLAAILAQRKEAEAESADARQWLAQLKDEHASTLRSRGKLEAELASLSQLQLVPVTSEDVGHLEAERDALIKRAAARAADAEVAEARLREGDGRVEQARLRLEMAVRRHEAALQHEALRAKKLTNLGPEKARAEEEIASATKAREKALADREELEAKLAALVSQRERDAAGQADKLEAARKARHEATAWLDKAHQAELTRTRLDARRASAVQRLFEEYGLTEEEALALAPNVDLPADAASHVARVRREMRAMGDVNLGAVEAFERLNDRNEELTKQKADVEQGIEEIKSSIRELDKLTRDRFLTTFEAVSAAFSEIFQQLFQGGEGAISLNDPDNTLDSGIEIDVTLPGKRRQRLELLSGGERSLCATAFLFALLKVKPSPLVVLDEVDAPLDGRNVERFVQLLQDYARTTQFIVITHNPVTIEAAPIWLGVTMQEPGVSTLVPTRVPPQALVSA